MVTRRYAIGLIALLTIIGIAATEFTQKREKKNVSAATLKQECCEQFGELLLKQIPPLLQMIARLQTEGLMAVQGYLESDKQSWCAQASRPKLQQCRDRLISLQKKIDMVLAEGEQALKEMKTP